MFNSNLVQNDILFEYGGNNFRGLLLSGPGNIPMIAAGHCGAFRNDNNRFRLANGP